MILKIRKTYKRQNKQTLKYLNKLSKKWLTNQQNKSDTLKK